MKFGIIKERKNPPDRRVVFTPEELVRLQSDYPDALVKVESSDIRVFPDEDYSKLGIEVAEDISDCEVFFGVKEIPVDYLLPNKKYFFFFFFRQFAHQSSKGFSQATNSQSTACPWVFSQSRFCRPL